MQAARGEIGFDRPSAGRHCALPDRKCGLGALGVVAIRLCPFGQAAGREARDPAGAFLRPQTTRAQSGDDLLLIAARMAADQDLAVVSVADRKAWASVIM